MGDAETLIAVLNTAGLEGKRTFFHYLIHSKLLADGKHGRPVAKPDQETLEVVLGLRDVPPPPPVSDLWTPSGFFSRLLGA
jgi:hypothetical protein